MPDDLDFAQDAIDRELAIKLAAHRARPVEKIVLTGFCQYEDCGDETEGRWCSPECRDAWQASRDTANRFNSNSR